jgi:hypothetical protein
VAREEEGSGESYGGGWPESDAWSHRKAGGGTDQVATTASGGEAQLGQATGATWREQGTTSAGSRSGGASAGAARGPVQDGAEAAGVAHMAGQSGGSGARRETEGEM